MLSEFRGKIQIFLENILLRISILALKISILAPKCHFGLWNLKIRLSWIHMAIRLSKPLKNVVIGRLSELRAKIQIFLEDILLKISILALKISFFVIFSSGT